MASYFGWKLFFPVGRAMMAFGISGAVGIVFGLIRPYARRVSIRPMPFATSRDAARVFRNVCPVS